MNRSEVLRAVEWIDQAAREGDPKLVKQAKNALETQLSGGAVTDTPESRYSEAVESFVRKHGREPMEDLPAEEDWE